MALVIFLALIVAAFGGVVWLTWATVLIATNIADLYVVTAYAIFAGIGLITVIMILVSCAAKYLKARRGDYPPRDFISRL